METKAQTIVQLFRQLQRQHYAAEDLRLVHRAYALAVEICTCQYRSSGRTLIDHSVGIASILATLRREPPLVAAGLTHAVYLHGDFGTWRRSILPSKRSRLRGVIGSTAEELVYRYSGFDWTAQSIPAIHEWVLGGDAVDRTLVLMRLADQLDIYGEHDALYCNNVGRRREYVRDVGPSVVALADVLGHPALAAALQRAFTEVSGSAPIAALTVPPWQDDVIVPPSYRIRMPIAAYQSARARIYRMIGR